MITTKELFINDTSAPEKYSKRQNEMYAISFTSLVFTKINMEQKLTGAHKNKTGREIYQRNRIQKQGATKNNCDYRLILNL